MTEKPSDDIFALCSRFDLDQESYRVFRKSPPAVSPSDYSELPSAALAEAEPECTPLPTAQASRTALRNLCRHLELSENAGKNRNVKNLFERSVVVYGTAGGVGATTVSATLARLFAQGGKQCAIVDEHSESILPFFFGGQRAVYDKKRHAGLQAASETAVQIISKQNTAIGGSEDNTSEGNNWLQQSVFSLGIYLDHLIVDVQKGQEAALPTDAAPVALLVAVPDVSSLVGARAVKRMLSAQANGSQVICVLNKFDSSLALHAEIHTWFQENFQQVLTIGRSDLLNEALAEGLTVVDWMPQSAVAADFLCLLTVIQSMMPASSYSPKKGELSLCS